MRNNPTKASTKLYAIGVHIPMGADLWLVSKSDTTERSGFSPRTFIVYITQFHRLVTLKEYTKERNMLQIDEHQ